MLPTLLGALRGSQAVVLENGWNPSGRSTSGIRGAKGPSRRGKVAPDQYKPGGSGARAGESQPAGEGLADAALGFEPSGRRLQGLQGSGAGGCIGGFGDGRRPHLDGRCRPCGEIAQTMGQERARPGDLIGPGDATLAHVVVEGEDELGACPRRQLQVAGVQGVAELPHHVVTGTRPEAGRRRSQPAGEPLRVQWPRVAAPSLLFGRSISLRGAVRLAWRCPTHRTRPRHPSGTG